MKFFLATVLLGALTLTAQADPEKSLATLQLQEIALAYKLKEAEADLQTVRTRIANITKDPPVYNKKYYDTLGDLLRDLTKERKWLPPQVSDTSMKKTILNAQISFLEAGVKKYTEAQPGKP